MDQGNDEKVSSTNTGTLAEKTERESSIEDVQAKKVNKTHTSISSTIEIPGDTPEACPSDEHAIDLVQVENMGTNTIVSDVELVDKQTNTIKDSNERFRDHLMDLIETYRSEMLMMGRQLRELRQAHMDVKNKAKQYKNAYYHSKRKCESRQEDLKQLRGYVHQMGKKVTAGIASQEHEKMVLLEGGHTHLKDTLEENIFLKYKLNVILNTPSNGAEIGDSKQSHTVGKLLALRDHQSDERLPRKSQNELSAICAEEGAMSSRRSNTRRGKHRFPVTKPAFPSRSLEPLPPAILNHSNKITESI